MAFTCDFVRQDCSHAEIFRPTYQRTNRTKGSKILRCFPHCCPDHVTRSFCGAPLHLDVHWRRRDREAALPVLLAFGRFRLQQERGFAVGEQLAPDAVARSVQSDENPNGQWIKSALVERPTRVDDAQPWRFELNSSARWFYGWESGVAKSHRLREHVLDVLVAELEPATDAAGESLRVVALAQSPPFKMISFRRATPEALSLLSTSSAPTVPLPLAQAAAKPVMGGGRPRQRPKAEDDNDDNEETVDKVKARRWAREPVPASRPPPAVADPMALVRNLAVVWSFLRRIPLRSLLSRVPAMERVFWAKWGRRRDRRQRSEPPVDETLAHLLDLEGDESHASHQRLSGPLLHVASQVALWLWWDDALHAQWHGLVDGATDVLLDGRALRRWFEQRVVGWLWEALDTFLEQVEWSIAALVTAIARATPPAESPEDTNAVFTTAYERFVAHVRERFVDQQRPTDASRRSSKRPRLSDVVVPLPPTLAVPTSVFDGEWLATLHGLHSEPARMSASHARGRYDGASWRLVHLMWFWREFSALRFHFDAPRATLRVQSLVGWSTTEDRDAHRRDRVGDMPMAVLVLDHRCRWVRHLPSGASTLAVPLAGWLLGDYVGKAVSSGREIHVNCYAWPDETVSDRDLWATCFQVHVRATSAAALVVRVAVNRGLVDPRPLGLDHDASAAAVARELHLKPLPQKLATVPQWRASGAWRCEYARVGGR